MAASAQTANGIYTLTPNTTNSESSPHDRLSPHSLGKRSYDEMKKGVSSTSISEDIQYKLPVTTLTPVHSPPEPVPAPSDPRPPTGQIRVLKIRYDPAHDDRLSSRDRQKVKPTYVATGVELRTKGICEPGYSQHDKKSTEVRASDTLVADTKNEVTAQTPDPRLAIVGYDEGKWYIDGKPSKTRPRVAMRTQKPWTFDPTISVGRLPAKQVVVYGFDPFTPERNIRILLETYGVIASLENCIDPSNGSFLGVCKVIYADKETKHQIIKAVDSARTAEKDGNGQKIGVRVVRIERDPTGNRAKRYCRRIIEAKQRERNKDIPQDSTPTNAALGVSLAPLNAPKGPANRPPTGPRAAAAGAVATAPAVRPPPRGSALIETTSILATLNTRPFIFIPHASVPVMGTTIEHLKKRLRSFAWAEVRCDVSGYFVIFEDSESGIYEAQRCYTGCHGKCLFTYSMHMILHTRGNLRNAGQTTNPTLTRPPPKPYASAEKAKLYEQDVADFENEKRERAERLDPVKGALETLEAKLRDVIMDNIKRKIATPTLFSLLDPDKHREKRQKHGIPDPVDKRSTLSMLQPEAPTAPTGPGFGQTRVNGFSLQWRRTDTRPGKRPSVADRQMSRQEASSRATPESAYVDERRRKPVKRARPAQMHRRLQDFLADGEESDDDRHTQITRDSNEVDSRAVSEIPVTPLRVSIEDEPKSKRRKTDKNYVPDDSDDEGDSNTLKALLPHLMGKDPEDMAMQELQQVISSLPRISLLRTRALKEVKVRKQAEEDNALFGLGDALEAPPSVVDIKIEDMDSISTPEPADDLAKPTKKKTAKAAAKVKVKKTKKQLLEEQEAERREEEAKAALHAALLQEEIATPTAEAAVEEEEEEPRAEVEWSVSTDKPRRTVEDDPDLYLDIDGWQHIVKDDEDLKFLRMALDQEKSAPIVDTNLWAWNQKQIKALNNDGKFNLLNQPAIIHGYYKPNASGSARSEPITKILNAEKNHYLPHRIRVQKAREERQALANAAPADVPRPIKVADKFAGNLSSRQARAENRRVVNAVASVKQALGEDNVAVSFNQLKKRKKQVRFDRSAIHNWGLYADENIGANEMIIEYVGEVVRQKVADIREQRYDQQGVGSSYLFRMADDRIVDATKKGGIARFINHSCDPSCTAKIIRVDGTHRIVIYALRDIGKNEELTYDYKFEREINSTDRIPCLCGAANCKGFLN